jgi:hypothetical protein
MVVWVEVAMVAMAGVAVTEVPEADSVAKGEKATTVVGSAAVVAARVAFALRRRASKIGVFHR